MKKTFLTAVIAGLICGGAYASDGGVYTDVEQYATQEVFRTDTVVEAPAPRRIVAKPTPRRAAPCARMAGEPVAVKTHTEVIDHYQTYQPVVSYVPAGEYSTRRVVQSPRPRCSRCGY